jgi:hypothetical protein
VFLSEYLPRELISDIIYSQTCVLTKDRNKKAKTTYQKEQSDMKK